MKKIAIFHYNPIELFPPVMNMINILAASEGEEVSICVFSTKAGGKFKTFEAENGGRVKIFRLGEGHSQRFALVRVFYYFLHYLSGIFYCMYWRPRCLFYIETMSAPAPLILKSTFLRKSKLFIHYHEYMSPSDYGRSPFMNIVHRHERKMYPKAAWVSHTNAERMKMFLEDVDAKNNAFPVRIMPNFPLRKWSENARKTSWQPSHPLRIVYVGAVDLTNLYFAEFLNWIENQNGNCTLTVISNQDVSRVEDYAKSINSKYVAFKPSMSYFQLPSTLVQFDIGVILYKGNSTNFMFNAPNKLFEYLNVGLDVWFPAQLQGIRPYIRTHIHPMVLPLDFDNLEHFSIDDLYKCKTSIFEPSEHYAESIYRTLRDALVTEN